MADVLESIIMSATYKDRRGVPSSVSLPFCSQKADATPLDAADIEAAWTVWKPLVQACMAGLVYTGRTITTRYYDNATDPATATGSHEHMGTISFHTVNQKSVGVNIPGFSESCLITVQSPFEKDYTIVDMSNASVSALVTSLIAGVASGGSTVQLGLEASHEILSVKDARYEKRNSKK